MAKLRRIIKWLLLGAGLLLLLAMIALVVYTRSDNFTRWVREEAVAAVNNIIRGSISVERLEGTVWKNVVLYNVTLRYENAEVVKIPRLEVSFSLWGLLLNRLKISQIDALKPGIDLAQDREGKWNLAEALAPRKRHPEEKSEFTTLVRSLRLRDGAVDLRMASDGGKLYRLQNLDLEGGAAILPDDVRLEVHQLATALVSKGLPELRLKGALDYHQTAAAAATVKLKDLWAVSRNSRVKLDGEIAQAEPLKIKGQAVVDKLASSDIAYFVADWPLKRDLSGSLAVEGTIVDLQGNLNLAGAGAKLAGKFRVDAAQSPLRYTATMTVSGFDLQEWLGKKDFAGVVNGTAEARGDGFALQNIAAKMQLEVRAASVQGWALGNLETRAELEKGTALLSGQLNGSMGSASWSGKVALKDKRPAYDLALTVKDLAVEKVVQNANTSQTAGTTKGKLNLQGTVRGTGFSLADMNTRAEVRILPSTLGPVALRQGLFDMTVREKKILISRGTLNAADSVVTVNGEIGIDAKATGKLAYRFRAADIGPWLALANQKGSGSVNLAGQAQGSLADFQTQGKTHLAGLRLDSAVVRNGDIVFAMRSSKDQLFPEGVVTFRMIDLDAGLALRRVDGKATLSRAPAQTIQLDLSAQDSAERKHALNGTINFAPDVIAARLNQISLTAPDGTWKLAEPAMLTKRDGNFFVEKLSLKNGDKEVSLDGRVGLSGSQDLRLNVDRMPLETLSAFMAQPPKISGIIAGTARISGTAAAPEIISSLKLSDPTIAGQAYAGATAEVQYRDKKAVLRAVIQQDAAHSLNANGTVPLVLSWHDKFRAETLDGMDVRVQSAGVSIGFLNAFSGKAVENIAGEMELNLAARGSLKQPDLRGNFRLRDGRLKIVSLNVDVNTLAMSGGLDSRNLVIREISAKAKDGEIRGAGSLSLKQYEVSGVKLTLNAKRWPAIDTARYQLRIAGNVDVEGALSAPVVKGQINITEGSLRPDLAFLEQSKAPYKRDETIVVKRDGQVQAQQAATQSNGSADNGLFNSVTLDLAMHAPGNVWVRHPDLVAELSGNVRVAKAQKRNLDLSGRVEVVRGYFAFQGRRFQITRGTVEFIGGDKINPSLDIVAEYRLPQYEVEVKISGMADKPTLTLSSQPALEQSDILAVILFGRPLNRLNQSEQVSLQQSAANLATGFVAGAVANSVAKALGLESLGIDVSELDFSSGKVGFGRYFGRNTYVSASQEVTGEHGREVRVEYEVAKDIKIGTSASSTGGNGIDIIWHKRY
jgi:autotransporter translocation and assembly factor TamB